MLRDHLRRAFRTLRRHRGYAALNVAGLAVGMACCLMIGLYVRHETGYDRFHERADRIHRLVVEDYATSQPPAAEALERDYPEQVAHAARLWPIQAPATIRVGDDAFVERRVSFADPNLFSVFTLPAVAGDLSTALDAPGSIVLTASLAQKYFGDEPAVGRSVTFWGEAYEVTAVIEDVPPNTHYPVDALVSMASLRPLMGGMMDNWRWAGFYTYVLLQEGVVAAELEEALASFYARHTDAPLEAPRLQPLTDIYLHSDLEKEAAPGGHAGYAYLLATIAALVLVVAGINFVNLATARSAQRAREVGLRKALGARREQLVAQFLGESVLLSLIALGLALALVELARPLFGMLAGKPLAVGYGGPMVLLLLGLALAVGIGAGLYPALVLSRFRPTAALRGPRVRRSGGLTLRRMLVVAQFAVSVGLVVSALVVYGQLQHLQTERLGFDEERVVVAEAGNVGTFLEALRQQPAVAAAAATGEVPGQRLQMLPLHTSAMPADSALDVRVMGVDVGFIEAMGIEVAQGRAFSRSQGTDADEAFILNEAAARVLGDGGALGQPIELYSFDEDGATFSVAKAGTVVGVVEDFNFAPLHEPIEPLLLHVTAGEAIDYVVARLHPGDLRNGMAQVEAAWAAANPGDPFEAFFLDDHLEAQYEAERRLSRVFGAFTVLALFVAGLGLFGLAAFTTTRRTKEVGIRKVLGATVPGLVGLLSREMLGLVAVAFVVAAPLAYLALDRWLDAFAYRVAVGPGVFALALGLALMVAALAVGGHAVRAARANPADTLRYE